MARSGGIDCFIADTAKALDTIRITGAKAGKWKKLLAGITLPPHCLASGTKLDCFAQGPSFNLLKGYYDGKKWQKWANVGGSSINTQPYCNRTGTGFDCFWTSAGNHLIHRQRSGTAWQAEEDLDLVPAGSPVVPVQQRPICLAQSAGGRTDCLVRGLDGALWQKTKKG